MFQYLAALLAAQPGWLAVGISLHKIIPMKRPWLYSLTSLITIDFLWLANYYIFPQPFELFNILMLSAGFLYLPFFCEKGHRIFSAFTLAILISLTLVLSNLCILCLMALSFLLGIDPMRLVTFPDPLCIARFLLVDLLLIPFLHWVSKAMITHKSPYFDHRQLVWFLSAPFSQAVLLTILHDNLQTADGLQNWLLVFSGALLCVAADFAGILGYQKFVALHLVADQVREAEQQINTQSEYYRELQERILRVNRIRHDLNNQLKTAYYLLEQGHPEEVRAQLDSLQSCIQDHIGTRYCENMVVDAVLQEKAALCENLGLSYQFRVLVPVDLKIENAHLCSAFSNLLDNAIAAAQKAQDRTPPITLESDIHKGYLTIRCSNSSGIPSLEKKTDILRRHGLGLEILRKLCQLHDGSCETDYRDGMFYVTLVLKNQ